MPKADIGHFRVRPAYGRGADSLDWIPAHWRQESAMPDIAHGKSETQSPQAQLVQMATAHWVSRFLYVAARMNLADKLAKQPKTAGELAEVTGAAAPPLHRLMRTLAGLGLFTEDSEHRFSLTRHVCSSKKSVGINCVGPREARNAQLRLVRPRIELSHGR